MNKFYYNNLTPFKWFIQENFPFIEADFDAITEWQLFEKLGNEINKIINSENTLGNQVEDLTDAFIELQNYVNNYFDNLDVQDEINNKLNEMAQTGAFEPLLQTLFNGYQAQIDNLEQNVNNNYDVLNNKIDIENTNTRDIVSRLASGSPAGVYSSLADLEADTTADKTKIYLVTSNGHWYYNVNDTWTDGGQYLSNPTVEGITPNQTSFLTQKFLNIFDKTKTLTHGSMDNYGHIGSSDAHYLTGLCPCKPNTRYYKKNNFSGAFYDSEQNAISYWGYGQTNVTSPANAVYFQSWFVNEDLDSYYASTENRYTPYGYNPILITEPNLETIIESIANLKNKVYINQTDFFNTTDTNILNTKNILTGYALNGSGTVQENANFSTTDFLPLPAPTGHLYVTQCYIINEYDKAFNVIATHSGNDTAKDFDIAENTAYIRVCFATFRLANAKILLNETIESYNEREKYALQFRTQEQLLSIISQLVNNGTFQNNIKTIVQGGTLEKQKWTAVGDSWTEENQTAENNYVKVLTSTLNLETTNLGISGTGFKRGEANNNAYYQRVADIPATTEILTIMGSGNDLGGGYTLGDVTDTGTDTICGCINTTLDNVFARFPRNTYWNYKPCTLAKLPTKHIKFVCKLHSKIKSHSRKQRYSIFRLIP